MPELPEVECLTRAIRSIIESKEVSNIKFFRDDLREPIPTDRFRTEFINRSIHTVSRRSKYMLWHTDEAVAIFHLGMSGRMIWQPTQAPQYPHTHAVFKLNEPQSFLHYIDPRRFGFINLCHPDELPDHRYFAHLGPEPLASKGLAKHLFTASRSRSVPIKTFIMDAKVVVGVGNIYASESLFKAGIHPESSSKELTLPHYQDLAKQIKITLANAIKAGGTTFRDFRNASGAPGYFSVKLNVYGRDEQPCKVCESKIQSLRIGNRSSFFCKTCQKKF